MANLEQEVTASGSPTTISITPTAGNKLVMFLSNSGGLSTGNISAITDDKSNTWTQRAQGAVSGGTNTRIEIWTADDVAAGTTVITPTVSGVTDHRWLVQEWSGLAAGIETANEGSNASSVNADTGTVVTTVECVLLAAINYSSSGGSRTATHDNVGAIWTENTEPAASGSNGMQTSRAEEIAAGTYSDGWTLSSAASSGWGIIAIPTEAVGGGGEVNVVLLGGM